MQSMKSSSSANIDALRRLPALMMHNANIVFGVPSICTSIAVPAGCNCGPNLILASNLSRTAVLELLLTAMPVHLGHFAFAVMLGCTYLLQGIDLCLLRGTLPALGNRPGCSGNTYPYYSGQCTIMNLSRMDPNHQAEQQG